MSFLLSHVFSSTKLEKRAEQVCMEALFGGEEEGGREAFNVYTYE
jgi:hypothetical protein